MANALIDKFKALGQTSKLLVVGIPAIIGVLTFGTFVTDKPVVKKPSNTLPSDNVQSSSIPESVAASQQQADNRIQTLEATIKRLQDGQQIPKPGDQGLSLQEAKTLQDQIDDLKGQLTPKNGLPPAPPSSNAGPNLNAPLPNGSVKNGTASDPASPGSSNENQGIRIIEGIPDVNKTSSSERKTVAYLPAGSNFEAVLMNGVDANTSSQASRTPTPALLRVKTEAILPNLYTQDVKECFILVGFTGELSSERALGRSESISCVSETGKVFESKIESYIVGEDGKTAVKGRLVSKQGSLLAKGFFAGFASGLGNAFTAQPVQSINLQPGAQQSYQYPDPTVALGNGVAGGLSRSAQLLSQFYIQAASQMYPIIEVDAGRRVTVVLMKGLEIK